MDQGTVYQLSMFTSEVTMDPLVSAVLQINVFSCPPAMMDHFRGPQSDKE